MYFFRKQHTFCGPDKICNICSSAYVHSEISVPELINPWRLWGCDLSRDESCGRVWTDGSQKVQVGFSLRIAASWHPSTLFASSALLQPQCSSGLWGVERSRGRSDAIVWVCEICLVYFRLVPLSRGGQWATAAIALLSNLSFKSGGLCAEQSVSESGCGSYWVVPDLTLVCPLALRAVALLPDRQPDVSDTVQQRASGIFKVCFFIAFIAKVTAGPSQLYRSPKSESSGQKIWVTFLFPWQYLTSIFTPGQGDGSQMSSRRETFSDTDEVQSWLACADGHVWSAGWGGREDGCCLRVPLCGHFSLDGRLHF